MYFELSLFGISLSEQACHSLVRVFDHGKLRFLKFHKSEMKKIENFWRNINAITYDDRPKIKRDAGQKSSPFLRKRLLLCWAYLFFFDSSSYIKALAP